MPVFYRFFDSFTFTGGERMNSLLRVGIDVGSTTIKVVVLNKERELVYQKYARHFSEINSVLKENLHALSKVIENKKIEKWNSIVNPCDTVIHCGRFGCSWPIKYLTGKLDMRNLLNSQELKL